MCCEVWPGEEGLCHALLTDVAVDTLHDQQRRLPDRRPCAIRCSGPQIMFVHKLHTYLVAGIQNIAFCQVKSITSEKDPGKL